MEGGYWSASKKKGKATRCLLEEELNREGHWMREFTARIEAWPVVEQWATETGYHLAAMRGSRRLYVRNGESPFFRTFLDVKQNDRYVTLSAWIDVGFLARALSFFSIGPEMNPDPTGWMGVRKRREAAREINELLLRFRQPMIAESDRFHMADIDMSIYGLAAGMLIPVIAFSIPVLLKMEIRQGLSNALLAALGRQFSALGVWFAVLLIAQCLTVRQLKRPLYRGLSAVVGVIIFGVLSVVFFTNTSREMGQAKVAHYCLHRYDEAGCRAVVRSLSGPERLMVLNRLRIVEKELSLSK